MGRVLDHVDIRVCDRDACQRFYETVLAVLGRTQHEDDAAKIMRGKNRVQPDPVAVATGLC